VREARGEARQSKYSRKESIRSSKRRESRSIRRERGKKRKQVWKAGVSWG
jgi:hypothetical protein